MHRVTPFYRIFILSWATYFLLMLISQLFHPHRSFPLYGILGYATVICCQLWGFNYARNRLHYILLSASLITSGALASLDMVLSKQELAELWLLWANVPMTPAHIDGYMQTLILLLNIFTGSLAANSLFHGLNRNNFS